MSVTLWLTRFPLIWAWRKKRIHTIGRAVDHMLCLLPFEVAHYSAHGIGATYVGHPLADQIPLDPPAAPARSSLQISPDTTVIGLLPGSRSGEVKRLAPLFLKAAQQLCERRENLHFLLPCASAAVRQLVESFIKELPGRLSITVLDGQSHTVMAASDTLLLASGTAALEGMLHKKPMVVGYRLNALTHWLVRRMATGRWCSLPNILAQQELVPELLQKRATVENMVQAVLASLTVTKESRSTKQTFYRLHKELRCSANSRAADTVLKVLAESEKKRRGGCLSRQATLE